MAKSIKSNTPRIEAQPRSLGVRRPASNTPCPHTPLANCWCEECAKPKRVTA